MLSVLAYESGWYFQLDKFLTSISSLMKFKWSLLWRKLFLLTLLSPFTKSSKWLSRFRAFSLYPLRIYLDVTVKMFCLQWRLRSCLFIYFSKLKLLYLSDSYWLIKLLNAHRIPINFHIKSSLLTQIKIQTLWIDWTLSIEKFSKTIFFNGVK